MKNLNLSGIQEMDNKEMRKVNGGGFRAFLAGICVRLAECDAEYYYAANPYYSPLR